MKPPLIADTGGLLRALSFGRDGLPAWPDFEAAVREAVAVIVPAVVLAEIDYFLGRERRVMQKLVAEIFDPATRYEFEPAKPTDIVRAMQIDAKFHQLGLGLIDSVVAAVAERRRIHRVLTTDRTDFSALRVGERYNLALTLVP